MKHARRPWCFIKTLKVFFLLLLLVCFETLTYEQPFVACPRRALRTEMAQKRLGPASDTYLLWNYYHNGKTSYEETAPWRTPKTDITAVENKRDSDIAETNSSRSRAFGFNHRASPTLSEFDDVADRKTKRPHLRGLSSNCSCPQRMQSDRIEFGHVLPTPCTVHLDRIVLLNPRFSHDTGPSRIKPPRRTSGKRCLKLQSTAWTVDTGVNYEGQAKRNSLRQRNLKVSVPAVASKGHGANGQRNAEDLLLMSDYQRKGSDESGRGSIVSRLLVSLAATALLLGDLSRRQEKEGRGSTKKRRLGPHLLPGPRALNEHRTANSDNRQQSKANQLRRHRRSFSAAQDALRSAAVGSQTPAKPSVPPYSPRVWWVFPATGFLPTQVPDGTQYLDHVGYRVASLAALPTSLDVSRIRLAEAGFHYDPKTSPSAVLCHRCGASLNLESINVEGQSALNSHWSQSPNCPVLLSMLDEFTQVPPGLAPDQQWPRQERSAGPRTPPAQRRTGAGTERSDERDLSEDGEGAEVTDSPSNDRRQPLPGNPSSTGPQAPAPAPARTTRQQLLPATLASHEASASRDGPRAARRDESRELDLGQAVYPLFSTVQSRLGTFQNWQMSEAFSPDNLVALGFYYAGYSDCVRCFYCGVGLKSWEEHDDPLTEHLRWRPECGFLLRVTRRSRIDEILRRIRNPDGTDPPPLPSSQGSQQQPNVPDITQQLLNIGLELSTIERARLQLRESGEPEDIERVMAVLFPD